VIAALLILVMFVPVGRFSSSAHAETTDEVRTRLLGPGWDQPGVVRLKWITITVWLASFGGHVVMFDSTVMNYLGSPENKTDYISLDDVIAAKPEYIFQNHVHLDQMRHASRIATATGAKLVGAEEHCAFTKRDADIKGLGSSKVNCDPVRDSSGHWFTGGDTYAGSPAEPAPLFTPFGTIGKPDEVPPGLDVTVVKIKHTQLRPYPDSMVGNEGWNPDVSPYAKTPESPQAALDLAMTQDYEGGNLLYMFKYGDFTLVDHGSSGSLDPLEPGQSEIKSALRSLGANDRVDMEIGGIAELQNYANGLLDAQRYAEEIGAKVYIPQHHGNWNPPATAAAAGYYQPWKARIEGIDAARRPQLCFIVEANRATAFSINTSEWAGDHIGTITPLLGPGCYTG
jgi:L-ascorbate metabolism protein UlaG (beta-lactamase superfamily)